MKAPENLRGVELANRLRSLRASVSNEGSLVKIAMQNEIARGIDTPGVVIGRYKPELDQLWAWENHFSRLIGNEYSDLPQVETEEPEGDCMPRSRRRIVRSLRNEFDDGSGTSDPLFDMLAELFGIAMVLSIWKISDVGSLAGALQAEMKRRLKPPVGSGTPPPPPPPPAGGSVVTEAMRKRPKGPRPGKSAKKDDEKD